MTCYVCRHRFEWRFKGASRSGHGISAFRSGSIIIMKQTIGEIPYDDQLCMGA
jgi:hypothetical protein